MNKTRKFLIVLCVLAMLVCFALEMWIIFGCAKTKDDDPGNIVTKVLSDVEITKQPTKTEYLSGDSVDTTGLEVSARFTSGEKTESEALNPGDYTVSPAVLAPNKDAITEKQEITVTYTYKDVTKTAAFEVTVTNKTNSATITVQPTKTEYLAGDKFDISGTVMTVVYDGNVRETITLSERLSEITVAPETLSRDTSAVKITYKGFTDTVPVTMVDFKPDSEGDIVEAVKDAIAKSDGDTLVFGEGEYDFGGETITVDGAIGNIGIAGTDEGNVVIKNVSVVTAGTTEFEKVVLDSVVIEVPDKCEATFDNVSFSGKSAVRAVWDGALGFKGCTFDVAPDKYGNNSRATAIMGSHQGSTVDLVLDECTFNYTECWDRYAAAVFMWSSVENVSIRNCTFNGYGFVAVKLMNVVEGANILFEGNTFNMSEKDAANWYYNAAAQICPQHDNAFTAAFKDNVFTGDYQTHDDVFEDGVGTETAVFGEITGMNYSFKLTKADVILENNTLNGNPVTAENLAYQSDSEITVK